jgi:hypothetical protein
MQRAVPCIQAAAVHRKMCIELVRLVRAGWLFLMFWCMNKSLIKLAFISR